MLLSTDSRGWNILTSFYNYTIQAILVAKERSREVLGEQVLGEHFCGESVTENISGVMYFIKTDVYDDEVNQLRKTILRQRDTPVHQPQPSNDLQYNSPRSLIFQLAAVTKV